MLIVPPQLKVFASLAPTDIWEAEYLRSMERLCSLKMAYLLAMQREYGGGVGNPIFEEFFSDFDDDVDGDDSGAVWQQYFGNTLDLEGLFVKS